MGQHVLYITVDSLRADRTGYQGYDRPTTPTIDSLAAEGTAWTRAMASGIPTYFSFPSLLGGVAPLSYPGGLGLPAEITTLAEAFREQGYQTAGFNAGNPWLRRSSGYERGFESYRDFLTDEDSSGDFGDVLRRLQRLAPDSEFVRNWGGLLARTACAATGRMPLEPAETVTAAATEWLDVHVDPQRPIFLWVHYMDPHYPWVPPRALREKFHGDSLSRRDLGRLWHTVSYLNHDSGDRSVSAADLAAIDDIYDAEVRRTDDAIADLLDAFDDAVGLADSLVAVVGDHGTELADHGGFSHGPRSLYDEVVRVPLVVRGPDIPSTRRDEAVSLLDVPSTLLRQAIPDGTDPVPSSFDGTSLFGAATSQPITNVAYGFDPATDDTCPDETLTAAVDWPWKLVDREDSETRELYNLERDPDEQDNCLEQHPERAETLLSTVQAHREWTRRRKRTMAEKARVRERIGTLEARGEI